MKMFEVPIENRWMGISETEGSLLDTIRSLQQIARYLHSFFE